MWATEAGGERELRAAFFERRARRERTHEDEHRVELVHSLEPVFGAAASAAAAALVGAAARDGAIVLHRRDDGAVEAVPGAGDGARARGALDGLLSSRTRARRGDEEAAAAGAEPAPGRRLALERELQSLDRAIEAQPLAARRGRVREGR